MSAIKQVIPLIEEMNSIGDFFRELVRLNKRRNPRISTRWYASKLGWAPSYINDVISGRRHLHISRVFELASFLKLDPYDGEKLVLLLLASHPEVSVKEHFSELRATKIPEENIPNGSKVSFLLKQAVWALLVIHQKRISNEIIAEALYSIEDAGPDQIEQAIQELISEGYLKIGNRGQITSLKEAFFIDLAAVNANARLEMVLDFVHSISNCLTSPRRQSPGSLEFSVAPLTERSMEDLSKKFAAAYAQVVKANRKRAPEEKEKIYQVGFQILPIADESNLR